MEKRDRTGEDRSERQRLGNRQKRVDKNKDRILLVADSVMELMGFCHFLSSQCLLNRGLCIQKDH